MTNFGWEEKLELGVSSIMFLYSFQLYQLPQCRCFTTVTCPGSAWPAARVPVPSPSAALVHCQPLEQPCPCPGPLCQLSPGSAASKAPTAIPRLPQYRFLTTDMVRTRGGSRLRPRVRFSTPEQKEQAPTTATVPHSVLEEPQGFRRYQTTMGPRAPSPVP